MLPIRLLGPPKHPILSISLTNTPSRIVAPPIINNFIRYKSNGNSQSSSTKQRPNSNSNKDNQTSNPKPTKYETFMEKLLSRKTFNPFDLVTDPDYEIPSLKDISLKEFTSNPNHHSSLGKYNKLKPVTPNDSYVSCTVFDKSGRTIVVSRKYPKMQFLREHNLYPRDLRKIDTSTIDVAPQIMVRPPNTILVNLLHIKALIKEDRVMVFDTSTPEIATKLGLFVYDLESKLKLPTSSPYEFKALETILINVMGYLEAELKVHIRNCGSILSELEHQVDRKKLQDLLINLKSLQSYYQKALLIKGVLENLLDNDEDLAGMYLTDKSLCQNNDFEELENILEAYYGQCDEFVQHSGSLVNDIKSTEDIVNIILDSNRNALMLFELRVTIYTLGITFATLVPAFYGMNLKNFIEESEYGFGLVVLLSVIQGLVITAFNIKALNKVQKLTMMGGSNHRKSLPNTLHMRHMYPNSYQDYYKNRHRWSHLWYRWSHLFKYLHHKQSLKRNKYYRPTMKERQNIWRMMNDDKRR